MTRRAKIVSKVIHPAFNTWNVDVVEMVCEERVLWIDARQALGWVKLLKCFEMEEETRGFVRNAQINFAAEITLLEMIEEKKEAAVHCWCSVRNWMGRKQRRGNRKQKTY